MAEDKASKIEAKRTVLPPAGEEEMIRNINPQAFRPETLKRFKKEVGWTKDDRRISGEPDPNRIQREYVGGKEAEDKESQS